MSISYAEALIRLQRVAEQLQLQPSASAATRSGHECLELEDTLGHISAADIWGDKTLPPFDNSAMDGYAVTSASTRGATREKPVRLRVLGSIAAGDPPPRYSCSSSCTANRDREKNVRPAAARNANAEDAACDDSPPLDSACYFINTGAPFPVLSMPIYDNSSSYGFTGGKGSSSSTCGCAASLFDACLRKEDARLTKDEGDTYIECFADVRPRMHRRLAGEDFEPGTKLLSDGDSITAEKIAALASHGIAKLDVVLLPIIAVLSTGKELEPLAPTAHPRTTADYNSEAHTKVKEGKARKSREMLIDEGHIYDSNSYYLASALRQWGYGGSSGKSIKRLGRSTDDDPEDFRRAVSSCMGTNGKTQYDILITTGGVSMGQHDYVAATLSTLGAEIHFHGVKMRPGHPALVATIPRSEVNQERSAVSRKPLVVFSLPGNPCAAAATLRFLVEPFLRYITLPICEWPKAAFALKARLLSSARGPSSIPTATSAPLGAANAGAHGHGSRSETGNASLGLRNFLLGKYDGYNEEGVLLVRTLSRGSGMVRPLSEADCWISIEEQQIGSLVSCYPIRTLQQ